MREKNLYLAALSIGIRIGESREAKQGQNLTKQMQAIVVQQVPKGKKPLRTTM